MRTRLVAYLAAAVLAAPFFSPAAGASSWDHKCEESSTVEHKCDASFSEDHCDDPVATQEKCDSGKG